MRPRRAHEGELKAPRKQRAGKARHPTPGPLSRLIEPVSPRTMVEEAPPARSATRATVHWVTGLLLVPLCFLLLVVLMKMILWRPPKGEFWTWPTVWFTGGAALSALIMWSFPRKWLLYCYVAGHEFTHWIAVRGCLGKTGDMSIKSTGGYVMASKTNWLINLSPYFFPFWAIVACSIYFPFSLHFDLPARKSITLLGEVIPIAPWWLAVAGLGLLWTFHMVYTCKMINSRQPDLHEQGTFFSLIVIVFFNLLIMNLLYVSVSGTMTYPEWFRWVNHNFRSMILLRGAL